MDAVFTLLFIYSFDDSKFIGTKLKINREQEIN